MIYIVLSKNETKNNVTCMEEVKMPANGKAAPLAEDNMARKYFEQMLLDELELGNYLGFQRWYATSNPLCYNLSENQDFRNATRPSRFDFHAFDYYRQLYWMPQGVIFPNYETFPLLKRNEKRSYHGKTNHFQKEKRSNGERKFYSNQADDVNSGRVERGKTDFGTHFEKRYQQGWNRETQHYHLSRDDRSSSRLSYRNSNVDLNGGSMTIDQQLQNFKQILENRHPSLESLHATENLPKTSCNDCETAEYLDSPAVSRSSSELDWKNQIDKISKNQGSDFDATTSMSNSYESWYCPEEQQQIIDMLKEVNLRHDRQLERDRLSDNEQPYSDESRMSNSDAQSTDSLRKYSPSSEEDEDHIKIILFPSTVPSNEETATKSDEQLKTRYNEKSASDFIEEFQNIFTDSPERKIINSLTKENLKISREAQVENFGKGIPGKGFTDEDKDAVRAVLDFDHVEDEMEKPFSCANVISSSPKKVSEESLIEKDSTESTRKRKVSEIAGSNNASKTISKLLYEDLNLKSHSNFIETGARKKESNVCIEQSCMKVEHLHKSAFLSPKSKNEYFEENSPKNKQTVKTISIGMSTPYSNKIQYSKGNTSKKEHKDGNSQKKLERQTECQAHTHCTNFNETAYPRSHVEIVHPIYDDKQNTLHKGNYVNESKWFHNGENCEFKCLEASTETANTVCKSVSEPLLIQKESEVVHKRISVSEIFDSVRKFEENYQNISTNRYLLPDLRNQNENIIYLTPSEHLKKILGIGENSQNKSGGKKITKYSADTENGKHPDKRLSSSTSKDITESTIEDYQSISSLKIRTSGFSVYEKCSNKNDASTQNKVCPYCASGTTSSVLKQKGFASPTVFDDLKVLKEKDGCKEKPNEFLLNNKKTLDVVEKADSIHDHGIHSELVQATNEKKPFNQNVSDVQMKATNSIRRTGRSVTIATGDASASNSLKNEQADKFISKSNERKISCKRDKYSTNFKDSEVSVTDEKDSVKSRKDDNLKLDSAKTSRITRKKRLTFVVKDECEDQSRKQKLIQEKENEQKIKKRDQSNSCISGGNMNKMSSPVRKSEKSLRNTKFSGAANSDEYASLSFQKKYNDLISKFNQDAERRKFRHLLKKDLIPYSVNKGLTQHMSFTKYKDFTASDLDWKLNENLNVSSVKSNNSNVKRKYPKDKFQKSSVLDIDWYSSKNYNVGKQQQDDLKYEKEKSKDPFLGEITTRKMSCVREITNKCFGNNKMFTEGKNQLQSIQKKRDVSLDGNKTNFTSEKRNNSFSSENKNISEVQNSLSSTKLLDEICECAYSNATYLCTFDGTPSYMKFSHFDNTLTKSCTANLIYLDLISGFRHKGESEITRVEEMFTLLNQKNVPATQKSCKRKLDEKIQYNRGSCFIFVSKYGCFSNPSNYFVGDNSRRQNAKGSSIRKNQSSVKEMDTLGRLKKKDNDKTCSNNSSMTICIRKRQKEHKKSRFSELFSKEHKKINVIKNASSSKSMHILVASPKVLHKYLKNKQALKFNHFRDVYTHFNLRDILFLFSSVKQSPVLSNSLHLSMFSVIDQNLFHAIPQVLNFLSVLSILNIPWTNENLKELLDLCHRLQNFSDFDLLKLQRKEMRQTSTDQVLNCWDIISSFMKIKVMYHT